MLNDPDRHSPAIYSCPGCGDQNHFQLIRNSYLDFAQVRRYLWHLRCACCGWNNHKSNLAQHVDRTDEDTGS